MDMIKKFFPFSFNFKEKDVNGLVVSIIIYVVAMVLSGVVFGLLGLVPILGIITSIIGSVVGLYLLVGLVFSVLNFFNVLK